MTHSVVFKPDSPQIADEILDYLAGHPEAEDSLDGIIQWWLTDQKILYQTKQVMKAISDLVAQGFLTEHKKGSSRILYRLNRDFENLHAV